MAVLCQLAKTMLSESLKRELESAIGNSRGLHSSNISRDHLGVFVRAAKIDPATVIPAIDILISNMKTHRSNVVASLYCLSSIADVNNDAKKIVNEKVGEDTISYYIDDETEDITNNAKVLQQVINGAPMSKFSKKQDSVPHQITNYGNMNINSPHAV
jgi:hypothetical protein